MKIRNICCLLLAALLLPLLAACTEPEPGKDAVLVVEQYPANDSGMLYVTCTMTWEQGKLQTMRFEQTYDTAESAASFYLVREMELGDEAHLQLEGKVLSYNISIEPWEDKTYKQMLEAMQKDEDWQVVADLSGESD